MFTFSWSTTFSSVIISLYNGQEVTMRALGQVLELLANGWGWQLSRLLFMDDTTLVANLGVKLFVGITK